VGIYEGLAPGRFTFMHRRYPKVPVEVLQALSERQASLVLGLALRNRDLLKDTILREGISCDFSPKGWLHIAADAREEQGICDEVSLAAQHGQRISIWPRGKIAEEFGIEADFLGRFIPGDGTYHPFKYVCGQLRSALRDGVALYTRTRVRRIDSLGEDEHHVVTERGTIVARRLIVATNAFTRDLLPELARIEPYQSQNHDYGTCRRPGARPHCHLRRRTRFLQPTARGSARGARLLDHGWRRRPADAQSRVAPPIA